MQYNFPSTAVERFSLDSRFMRTESVKEIGFQQYKIKINNFFMPLPFNITANDTTSRIIIPAEGIEVKSVLPPQVDAKGFYLKRVTIQ